MAVRVGDIGRALSPMSPSGAVEVNGQRLDARSDGRFIEVGSQVVVLRGDPTGYVVCKLEPGDPPPTLSDHGEAIRKAEFQRSHAEVAEADRQERAEKRKELSRRLRREGRAAGGLGAFVGLGSGAAGWQFGWCGAVGSSDAAPWLGGALVVGAAAGVLLFFLARLVGSGLKLCEWEAGFVPAFFATFAGLLGASIGFWWRYGTGDAATMAAQSAGCAFVFAVVACLTAWAASNILGSAAGE